MTAHTIKLLDQKANIMVLSRGYLEDETPYYAYVLMPPSSYLEYRKVSKKGSFDLKQYGEVVRFGKSIEPPQIVIDEIRRKYGDSSYFEEEIKDKIEKLLS